MPLHLPLSQSFPNSPPGQMLAGSGLHMPREKYTLPTSVNTLRAPLIFLKEAWESLAKAGRAVFYTSKASDENTDCSTELTQGMPQGSQLWGQSEGVKHCLACPLGHSSNSWHRDVLGPCRTGSFQPGLGDPGDKPVRKEWQSYIHCHVLQKMQKELPKPWACSPEIYISCVLFHATASTSL